MAVRTALLRLSVETDHSPSRFAGAIITLSRKTFQSWFDPYHPERHYMRGPGPRWQAKHGERPASDTDA
jgi:hypothetical protein